MTFHERAGLLQSARQTALGVQGGVLRDVVSTGATKDDSWIDIDGGIGTVFVLPARVRASCPTAVCISTAPSRGFRRGAASSAGTSIVPREGAAVHINAFNFPVWGMLEKLAPAILAGVPVIVKPATATAYLTELVVRRIIESGILPEGSLQLVCGSLGDLFEHLTCQDIVSFTGSAHRRAAARASDVDSAMPFGSWRKPIP